MLMGRRSLAFTVGAVGILTPSTDSCVLKGLCRTCIGMSYQIRNHLRGKKSATDLVYNGILSDSSLLFDREAAYGMRNGEVD